MRVKSSRQGFFRHEQINPAEFLNIKYGACVSSREELILIVEQVLPLQTQLLENIQNADTEGLYEILANYADRGCAADDALKMGPGDHTRQIKTRLAIGAYLLNLYKNLIGVTALQIRSKIRAAEFEEMPVTASVH